MAEHENPKPTSAEPEPPSAERRRWSFHVVRIAAIDIRIHVSFLVLVAVFAWASSLPGGPGAWYGVAWILCLFACVLGHELGHSLVGRARGAPATEILLMPLGGISKLERLPDRPQDELVIALAGPATSLAIGAGVGVVAVLAGGELWPPALTGGGFLVGLAWVNVLLAAFNLLPAFPLDGGRVLRAWLHEQTDLETATRNAARIGRNLALAMGLIGLLLDPWLVLIALFVWFGSTAEERATLVHVRLGPLRVTDAMIESPLVADGSLKVAEFIGTAVHHAQRVFPVAVLDSYVGLVDRSALRHADPGQALAALCHADAPRFGPEDHLEEDALPALAESALHAGAVLVGDLVVGVLRLEDVSELLESDGR